MATFYVLPPRSSLNQAVAETLGRLLPGLPLPADLWDVLVNCLENAAQWPEDVFLVPRDDLVDGEPTATALGIAFGAEPGDRFLEISLTRDPATVRGGFLTPADVSHAASAR
jgi:hypothetical protein